MFKEAIQKKSINKENVLIFLDPLPPPNKEKNRKCLSHFLGEFHKPNLAILNHKQSGYYKKSKAFLKRVLKLTQKDPK